MSNIVILRAERAGNFLTSAPPPEHGWTWIAAPGQRAQNSKCEHTAELEFACISFHSTTEQVQFPEQSVELVFNALKYLANQFSNKTSFH